MIGPQVTLVGRNGAGSAVPHRFGGADRRPLPDRQGQRDRRPLSASTSATTCGPGITCTSPIRTTGTTTSAVRSRSRRCPSSPWSSATDHGSDSGPWCCREPGSGGMSRSEPTPWWSASFPTTASRSGAPARGHPPLHRRRGLGASRAVAHPVAAELPRRHAVRHRRCQS